jgi:HlyD family secretion protein
MDMPRTDPTRKRRLRRIGALSAGLAVLGAVTLALARLEPTVPVVQRTSLWLDTVKRGSFLRQVHGTGTLVPEEIRWVTAVTPGRIERIPLLPGVAVTADTILIELTNPELTQAAFDAGWGLKAVEADLANLRVQLESQRLNQQAAAATAESNYVNARLDAEVNEELARERLVADVILRQSRAKAEGLRKVSEVETERLEIIHEAIKAQLAAQEAKVEQLRAQLELKRQQVDALKVRAGLDGVLQQIGDLAPLQAGHQVGAGTKLALVTQPSRLKAEIKVSETQARDIQLGQGAAIDTHNGVVPGRVVRVDPAVQNGTVTVDVALDGPLPKGARPDLSVDGIITLERLEDVLHVRRPVNVPADGKVGLFKVLDGGAGASRVSVELGRSSFSTIEVLRGLEVGDQVVTSDMSRWEAHDRIRID